MSHQTLTELASIAPIIEVRGEITTTNFPQLREAIQIGLSRINSNPQTDAEFGQAEQDAKGMRTLEKALTDAKAVALKQAEDVYKLFAGIDATTDEIRTARLNLERVIKSKKDEIKQAIVDEAVNSISSDLAERFRHEVVESMKGKRTIESLQAAAMEVATLANSRIQTNRSAIDAFADSYGIDIIYGAVDLEIMDPAAMRIELDRRVERKVAADAAAKAKSEAEVERKRIQSELDAEREKARQERLADQARSETERVRSQAAAELKQEPRTQPITERVPEPTPTLDDAKHHEFATFVATAKECFATLRAAKESLYYDENMALVSEFSLAVNAAWNVMMAKGGNA